MYLLIATLLSTPIPVNIEIAASESKFITPDEAKHRNELQDTAHDLAKHINKSKKLSFSKSAELTLVVIARGWADVDTIIVTYNPVGNYITAGRDKNRFIGVALFVDNEKVATFKNKAGVISWGQAASQIVKQLEEFVMLNAESLR